jgi:FkbM family methyltransferase
MLALGDVDHGCYVVVGASDPFVDTFSAAFYKRGWRGLHVEPMAHAAQRLREARPGDDVIQAVVRPSAAITVQAVEAERLTNHAWTANIHRDVSPSDLETDVLSISLANVLDRLKGREIHWLKIDVPGSESEILKSWRPSKVRPWVVLVRQTRSIPSDPAVENWQAALFSLGYELVQHNAANWTFVSGAKIKLKQLLSSDPATLNPPNRGEGAFAVGLRDKKLASQVDESAGLVRQPEDASTTAMALDVFRAQLVFEIDSLRKSVDRFQVSLDQRDSKILSQTRTIDSLRAALEKRDDEIERATKSHDALDSELRAVRTDLAISRNLVENRTRYIDLLHTSRSWRITAPLRRAVHLTQYVRRGLWAWVSFKPGSRPHRVAMRLGIVRRVIHQLAGPAQTNLLSWDQSAQSFRSDPPTIYLFVDHTVGCDVNTGVQRTVRGLASGLLNRKQLVRFVKWDGSLHACVLIDAADRDHLARWNGPAVSEYDRNIYLPADRGAVVQYPQPSDWVVVPEATCITNQNQQVTFDLIRWAREAKTRIGFIFYDAIPLRRPELASSAAAQKTYLRGLQYADAVWSISAWSAADLIAFWSAENAAGHPPVYAMPLPGALAPRRPYESKATDNLILSVGTIEPRKNQVALVRAFQAFRDRNPESDWQLVLVGNLHASVAQEIDAATQADQAIRYAGHASEDELAFLFASCAFTVFPSVEEGFGLPILESLWHGKPCLCADFGAMAEVAVGGGCLTCDTRDDAALSKALDRLISDTELRSELAQQAQHRQMLSWSDYADNLLKTTWPLGQIYFLAQATAEWERNTGIQRVVRQLGRALLDLGLDVIPVKLAADGTSLEPMTADEIDRLSAFNGPALNQWRGWLPPVEATANSWFVMSELPLHLSPQSHHDLIANLRKASVKSAAVFYDAIPWKMTSVYPEHYGHAHARYMHALAKYDLVTPISMHSENDLLNFLTTSEAAPYHARINAVILPGEFSESPRSKMVSLPSAEGPIKILSVGTIEPRKNYETLLEAFVQAAATSKRPLHLTLVGSSMSVDPAVPDRVRSFISRHASIVWEEHADDARVKELYETCDFTVYPSIEEGFGLPILESLWYGKPVICANFGSMREIVPGGGCIAVDVRDAKTLAAAIFTLADDPTRIVELSREAVGRPFRTWKDYAQDFVSELGLAKTPTVEEPIDLALRMADMRLTAADRRASAMPTKVPVYFLVESTAVYDRNTGIQRVVRQLARLLIGKGFELIPVRWDATNRTLCGVSAQGLHNLANFNGPRVQDWTDWRDPGQMYGGWFFLPEVQQHWKTGDHVHLIEQMKANGIRIAAVFYDAIPIKMPDLYPSWLVNAHYRYMIELGFYDLVFPISQFCAQDLVQFLQERTFADRELDRLIKPTILPGEFPESRRVTKSEAVDPSKPLRVLTIGTVEPRKNHKNLVLAFLLAAKRCNRPLELTMIGNTNAVDPGLAGQIREIIAGHPNVRWLETVDDTQMVEWNEWSDAMVYPSIEEGFGLPIVESLWHGKPVLCANFGAMAEVAEGGGCLTVDVRDVGKFAHAICRLADDTDLLTKLGQEAVTRPIRSWNDYAEEIALFLAADRFSADNVRTKRPESARLIPRSLSL